MNLQIEQKARDGYQIIKLSGEVDAYTAPDLREALIPLLEEQGANIIVDVDHISYMDSTGLGIFVAGLKTSKRFESHLKIVGLTPRVKRLFEITGLSEVMEIDDKVKGGQ